MSASNKIRLVDDFWQAYEAAKGSRGVLNVEYIEACKCVVIHQRHGDIFIKAEGKEGPELTQLILDNV